MTAIKYKEGGTWKTLTLPSAVHIGASAPDPTVKQMWVDTDEPMAAGYYSPPLVTQLPSAPFDGQEVRYLADDTNGIVWNLRYRAASLSAYKWEFVGGGEIVTPVAGNSNTTGGGGSFTPQLVDGMAIVGITAPLSGDYWTTWNAIGASADAVVRGLACGPGRSPGDNSPPLYAYAFTSNLAGSYVNLSGGGRLNTVVGGTRVVLFYLYTAAVITYSMRYLSLRPVRVSSS